jgi:hypothetical protein
LLLLASSKMLAQNQIVVKGAYDNDRSTYTLSSENTEFCDYHIRFNFRFHQNISSMPNSEYNAPPGNRDLCRLKPLEENQPFNISYSYTYFKGRLLEKINEDFIYLIPVKEDKITRFVESNSIREVIGKKEQEDFYAFTFTMEEGDTVFASRRGVVSSVTNEFSSPDGDYLYVGNVNSVEIFHEDGTFALYRNFSNGGVFVKKGQFVKADEALGRIGKIYDNVFVSMSINYLGRIDDQVGDGKKDIGFKFVKPKFAINEVEAKVLENRTKYTVVKPEGVVIQELSKREIKKRNALKK